MGTVVPITITYLSKDRPKHLGRSLDSLLLQTKLPSNVVITDCSEDFSKIEEVVNNIKSKTDIAIKLLWKPKEDLPRSMGRRLGRENSETKIIVSTESDIFFPEDLVEKAINAFGDPPKKCYAQPWFASQKENGEVPKVPFHYKGGFFQVYRAEDYDAVGGYNPFLNGWGWEDNDFDERMLAYGCEHVILDAMVYHMWHPPSCNQANNIENQKIAKNSKWDSVKKEWYVIK